MPPDNFGFVKVAINKLAQLNDLLRNSEATQERFEFQASTLTKKFLIDHPNQDGVEKNDRDKRDMGQVSTLYGKGFDVVPLGDEQKRINARASIIRLIELLEAALHNVEILASEKSGGNERAVTLLHDAFTKLEPYVAMAAKNTPERKSVCLRVHVHLCSYTCVCVRV